MNSVELVVVVGSIMYWAALIVVGVTAGAFVVSGMIVIPNSARINDPIMTKGLDIIFSPKDREFPTTRKGF
jgi:hypothetical protein